MRQDKTGLFRKSCAIGVQERGRRLEGSRMRVHPRRFLKIVLVVGMGIFAVLNLHLVPRWPEGDQYYHEFQGLASKQLHEAHVQLGWVREEDAEESDVVSRLVNLERPLHSRLIINASANLSHVEDYRGPDLQLNISDTEALKKEIERINRVQPVLNLHKFGLSLGADSVVVVVQAHDRVEHLRILFDSLAKVQGIEKVLLITSHDVFSHQLNKLVLDITFCPVLQIFLPYSQQIYYDKFPGQDPNDCPRDIKKDEALQKKCNNAEHPDKYGHYREAKYCQIKHHWIWKLQFVFEQVHLLDGYEGHVLLLEDDYFLAEDSFFSLQMMQTVRNKECPDCHMLVLGNYDKTQNYHADGGKMERAFWISSRHNLGMAFTRTLWNQIKKYAKEFCEFDDYNWDWTLQHLSFSCLSNKIRILKMKATRVFHIGECGTHAKSTNCNPIAKVHQVEETLANNKQFLFPNTFVIDGESRFKLREPKPNGGWGDVRDHNLCKSFFNLTTSPVSR